MKSTSPRALSDTYAGHGHKVEVHTKEHDMMEPWQHKFIGDREVESYRGRKIFESKLGTFGYEAWMTKLGDGWFCPYTSIDGAKQAIDALERMLEIWNRG